MSRLRALFVSFDSDGNGTVDEGEMDRYLVGVGIHSRAARAVVLRAVVRACGGELTWPRFVGISHFLVPPGVADRHGRLDVGRVDEVFDRIAGKGSATASERDVERYTRSTLPFFMRPFAGPLARAAAKGVVGTLSREGEACVRREDLREVVEEIVREKARLKAEAND
jgi:hypothetical protein